MNLSSKEMVEYVEKEMAESRPCPVCSQYGGLEQHQAGCLYLAYKGMTSPEESPDQGGQSLQSTNLDADVVSDDETSLPASPIRTAYISDQEVPGPPEPPEVPDIFVA